MSSNLHLPRVFWEGPGDSRSAQDVGPGSHRSAPKPEPRPQRPQARAREEAGSQLPGHMPEGLNTGVTGAVTCDVHAFCSNTVCVLVSQCEDVCVNHQLLYSKLPPTLAATLTTVIPESVGRDLGVRWARAVISRVPLSRI